MLTIFRRHLAPHEAHVLAGMLCASDVPAYVWGENTAHVYGDMALGGCIVAVDDACLAEAAEVLKMVPDDDLNSQTGEASQQTFDAGPPGILDLFCFGLMVSLGAAALLSLLGMSWSLYMGEHGWVWGCMRTLSSTLLIGLLWSTIFSIGAGLLLKIVRGYRAGSVFCRVVFIVVTLWTMLAAAFVALA